MSQGKLDYLVSQVQEEIGHADRRRYKNPAP